MLFVGTTTLTAGWMNMANIYYPMISKTGAEVPGYLNLLLTALIMASVVVILFDAIPKWYQTVKGTRPLLVEETVAK